MKTPRTKQEIKNILQSVLNCENVVSVNYDGETQPGKKYYQGIDGQIMYNTCGQNWWTPGVYEISIEDAAKEIWKKRASLDFHGLRI